METESVGMQTHSELLGGFTAGADLYHFEDKHLILGLEYIHIFLDSLSLKGRFALQNTENTSNFSL